MVCQVVFKPYSCCVDHENHKLCHAKTKTNGQIYKYRGDEEKFNN
jgi:hypothetical protein